MADDSKQNQQGQSTPPSPVQAASADPKLTAAPRESERSNDPKKTADARHVDFSEDRAGRRGPPERR
jgi:hypothetical protein